MLPHKHPEDRIYTVISGVFYIGLGEEFDVLAVVDLDEGDDCVRPQSRGHAGLADVVGLVEAEEVTPEGDGFGKVGDEVSNVRDAGDAGSGWGGGLGEDSACGYICRVEAVFEIEAEANGACLLAGLGDGEAGKVGNGYLASVDGQAHGEEGRGEGDHQHGQGAEDDVEDALHRLGQNTG